MTNSVRVANNATLAHSDARVIGREQMVKDGRFCNTAKRVRFYHAFSKSAAQFLAAHVTSSIRVHALSKWVSNCFACERLGSSSLQNLGPKSLSRSCWSSWLQITTFAIARVSACKCSSNSFFWFCNTEASAWAELGIADAGT